MAWEKQNSAWSTWTPNIRAQVEGIANPTATQERALSSVSLHSARYKVLNDVVYGHLVFTLSPPYFGGTHTLLAFQLPKSFPIIGMKTVGSGVWHTVGSSPAASGRLIATGNFWGDEGRIFPAKAARDTWAESNIYFNDDAGYKIGTGRYNNGTRYVSNHDGLRRLADNPGSTSIGSGVAMKFNLLLHYP